MNSNKGPSTIRAAAALAAIVLYGLAATANATDAPAVVFLGDSLTAGYGIDRDQAYPALVQEKIEAAGMDARVVAAGLSGDTSAGGLRRLDWVMRQPVDILVVALGANDGLRGIDLKSTRRNLQGIIDKARAKSPEIRIALAGMQLPPNLGPDYTAEFKSLFRELAEANDVELIPFLLEGVGGVSTLNLADGIHPNPSGHRLVAETVWKTIEPMLR